MLAFLSGMFLGALLMWWACHHEYKHKAFVREMRTIDKTERMKMSSLWRLNEEARKEDVD